MRKTTIILQNEIEACKFDTVIFTVGDQKNFYKDTDHHYFLNILAKFNGAKALE